MFACKQVLLTVYSGSKASKALKGFILFFFIFAKLMTFSKEKH